MEYLLFYCIGDAGFAKKINLLIAKIFFGRNVLLALPEYFYLTKTQTCLVGRQGTQRIFSAKK